LIGFIGFIEFVGFIEFIGLKSQSAVESQEWESRTVKEKEAVK